jgi:hypothetical protein
MLQYIVWGTSPMPLMHVMVVYTMSMKNLLTFAKARPAQMIFITTSIICTYTVGIGLPELESYPVGVALPLWDSIVQCQERPPSLWPPAAYDLIGQ